MPQSTEAWQLILRANTHTDLVRLGLGLLDLDGHVLRHGGHRGRGLLQHRLRGPARSRHAPGGGGRRRHAHQDDGQQQQGRERGRSQVPRATVLPARSLLQLALNELITLVQKLRANGL